MVTIYLRDSQNPQPYITETIPAREIRLRSSISARDRCLHDDEHQPGRPPPSPAPFDNVDLSQPLSGYDGTLFSISLVGPYFNVNFS